MAAVTPMNIDEFRPIDLVGALMRQVARALPISVKSAFALLLAVLLSAALWDGPTTLSADGRLALIVTVLCVIAWTLTRIPDSLVAIAGALALVWLGVLPADKLYGALGSEVVWLLIAAFIVAAVLKASGLVERFVTAALRPFGTITSLFYGLTLVIAATAFFIPSTSGRAALMLPIFLALAERLPDARLVKALALLFPSVILLSAGGSLIGAGAHFIAVDAMAEKAGRTVTYLDWMLLALPVALLSSLASAFLILRLFVPVELRSAPVELGETQHTPLTGRQYVIMAVVIAMITGWMTTSLHGVDITFIALAGAALLMPKLVSSLKSKEIFRCVETELIVFLAATIVLAEAIIVTGADSWLAGGIIATLPQVVTGSASIVIVVTAAAALLAHLLINSRTARAAVLIPAFALPLAALGHDPQAIIMVAVLGTGFCQTMMASAKPVAIYGNLEQKTFGQADLMKLAVPLLPIKFVLLVASAILLWPLLLGAPASTATATTPAPIAMPAPEAAAQPMPVTQPAERPRNFPGALCTREELRTVMLATIGERRMWASGWWHVWSRLANKGYPVEKAAIKSIYRGDDLVLLRRHSSEIAAVANDQEGAARASKACMGK